MYAKYRLQLIWYLLFCYVILEYSLVEGAPKGGKGRGRGKRKQSDDHTTGLYFCLVAFVLCLIPSLAYFFYNIYKDPLTPTLLNKLYITVREKSLGFLSSKEKHQ